MLNFSRFFEKLRYGLGSQSPSGKNRSVTAAERGAAQALEHIPVKIDENADLNSLLSALEASVGNDGWTIFDYSAEELAEIALCRAAKCDFTLARKFMAQADIATDCAPWALKGYRDITHEEQAVIAALDSSPSEFVTPFEFLFVHTGHVGTTALHNFLALHPNLLLPHKSEIDLAITDHGERDLALKYQKLSQKCREPAKSGIVQHGYIAGRQGGPEVDGKQPGIEVVQRLKDVVRSDRFYHLVRNPVDAVRSAYNHNIINRLGGGYGFPGNTNFPKTAQLTFPEGLTWPQEWEIPTRGMPTTWADSNQSPPQTKLPQADFSIEKEHCQAAVLSAFDRLKYSAVGENYSKHFPEWVPIDFNDLIPSGIEKCIEQLFQQLGVKEDYWHGIFATTAMSPSRRVMLNNFVILNGLDHPLFVQMDYAVQSLYSHTFPFVELATLKPNDMWQPAGLLNQPISLVANYEQWVLQSESTRKRLLQDGVLDFVLEHVILPAWTDCYPVWQAAVDVQRIGSFSDLIERDIVSQGEFQETMAPDVEKFLASHPNFAASWQSTIELF